jgi:S1-C subfamily serine protease
VEAEIELTLLRDEQKLVLRFTPRRFPIERADDLAWDLLGLRVRERHRRVEVEAVRRRSSAEQVGIRAGDVIAALGGQSIGSVDAFRRKLVSHRNAQRVLVSVQRGRQVYHVPLPLGAPL